MKICGIRLPHYQRRPGHVGKLSYSALCAASVKGCPGRTVRSARALFTVSSRSLVALAMRCNFCSSGGVKARGGWFRVFPMLVSFLQIMEMEEDKTGHVVFLLFQASRESSQAPIPRGLHEAGRHRIIVPPWPRRSGQSWSEDGCAKQLGTPLPLAG